MWHIRFVAFETLAGIVVFLFGLIIGSFLNVCIVRIPAHKSIVTPASACPKCNAPIRPYDNIPVISYLLLGGKCRACKTKISPMYPLVEILNAILFWCCYRVFGLTPDALKWATFSSLMLVLVCTDLRERILPDVLNFTGFGLGLILSPFTQPADGTARWIVQHLFGSLPPPRIVSLIDSLIGALVGSALLWLVSEAYFRLRHREGMGLGDVKLMLFAGAFLGAKRTLLTIFGGSLLGSILGLAYILSRRKGSDYELPFGSFLGAAALLVVFFGTPVVDWYQSLFTLR